MAHRTTDSDGRQDLGDETCLRAEGIGFKYEMHKTLMTFSYRAFQSPDPALQIPDIAKQVKQGHPKITRVRSTFFIGP